MSAHSPTATAATPARRRKRGDWPWRSIARGIAGSASRPPCEGLGVADAAGQAPSSATGGSDSGPVPDVRDRERTWPCRAPRTAGRTAGSAVLELTNGGFVAGEIRDSDRADVLRWLSPAFVEPFEFDLDLVDGVQYLNPADPPRPAGDKCFELAGGDVVFGTLVELDEREVVLDALAARPAPCQAFPDSPDRTDPRPCHAGLRGTERPHRVACVALRDAWRESSGRLATEKAKVTLRGDFGLPTQAVVEFEISWLRKPDFTLALGVDAGANDDAASKPGGFRFEVWGDDLTALHETDDKLALASVAKVSPGPGRVRLRACLDQEAGRLLVSAPDGEVLADLKTRPGGTPAARRYRPDEHPRRRPAGTPADHALGRPHSSRRTKGPALHPAHRWNADFWTDRSLRPCNASSSSATSRTNGASPRARLPAFPWRQKMTTRRARSAP